MFNRKVTEGRFTVIFRKDACEIMEMLLNKNRSEYTGECEATIKMVEGRPTVIIHDPIQVRGILDVSFHFGLVCETIYQKYIRDYKPLEVTWIHHVRLETCERWNTLTFDPKEKFKSLPEEKGILIKPIKGLISDRDIKDDEEFERRKLSGTLYKNEVNLIDESYRFLESL